MLRASFGSNVRNVEEDQAHSKVIGKESFTAFSRPGAAAERRKHLRIQQPLRMSKWQICRSFSELDGPTSCSNAQCTHGSIRKLFARHERRSCLTSDVTSANATAPSARRCPRLVHSTLIIRHACSGPASRRPSPLFGLISWVLLCRSTCCRCRCCCCVTARQMHRGCD